MTRKNSARTMPWQDVCPSVCLSVRLPHAGIVSKRLHISSKFFSPPGSSILVFPYQTGWQYSDWDPLTGALTARGLWKNTIYCGKWIKISCMIYRSAPFPMILNDPYPQFQGDAIFDAEYLRNGMTYSFNEILILTNTRPTQQCHFEWPWVTKQNIQWHEASHGLSATAELLVLIRIGQFGMILRKTLQSILTLTSSVCKFKLDSRTVEKQNEQLSATAIMYSNELKFVYGRIRVRLCRPYA